MKVSRLDLIKLGLSKKRLSVVCDDSEFETVDWSER